MRTKFLPLLLFFLLLSDPGESANARISYWISTYYGSADFSNFLALSGHTTEGDSSSNQANVAIMPAGSFTSLAAVTNDPAVPGRTNVITLVKNGLATAATCSVPNGSFTCSWTGNVEFNDGDLANIKVSQTGGIIIKGPWSIMTVFTVAPSGGRNWPFTS